MHDAPALSMLQRSRPNEATASQVACATPARAVQQLASDDGPASLMHALPVSHMHEAPPLSMLQRSGPNEATASQVACATPARARQQPATPESAAVPLSPHVAPPCHMHDAPALSMLQRSGPNEATASQVACETPGRATQHAAASLIEASLEDESGIDEPPSLHAAAGLQAQDVPPLIMLQRSRPSAASGSHTLWLVPGSATQHAAALESEAASLDDEPSELESIEPPSPCASLGETTSACASGEGAGGGHAANENIETISSDRIFMSNSYVRRMTRSSTMHPLTAACQHDNTVMAAAPTHTLLQSAHCLASCAAPSHAR
jgi:hypothetical protein